MGAKLGFFSRWPILRALREDSRLFWTSHRLQYLGAVQTIGVETYQPPLEKRATVGLPEFLTLTVLLTTRSFHCALSTQMVHSMPLKHIGAITWQRPGRWNGVVVMCHYGLNHRWQKRWFLQSNYPSNTSQSPLTLVPVLVMFQHYLPIIFSKIIRTLYIAEFFQNSRFPNNIWHIKGFGRPGYRKQIIIRQKTHNHTL